MSLAAGGFKMTQFFIDVFDGQTKHLDQAGAEFQAMSEARTEAVVALCDLMRHQVLGVDHNVLRTSIRDADGAVVYEGVLTFAGISYR